MCEGYVWKESCPISFKNLEKYYWNFEQPEEEILAMRAVPLYAHIHFIYRIYLYLSKKVLEKKYIVQRIHI